jgi:hypothetical protein
MRALVMGLPPRLPSRIASRVRNAIAAACRQRIAAVGFTLFAADLSM